MAKVAKIHCLSRKLEKSLKKQAKAKVRKEGKKQAKIILDQHGNVWHLSQVVMAMREVK